MTGNTLFQSNASVNVFKVEIYIYKQIKKSAQRLLGEKSHAKRSKAGKFVNLNYEKATY